MARMRLTGIDDALELGVREDASRDQARRQVRPVARRRRRDRRHRGRLHELRRMRLRLRDTDRLQRVAFVEARRQPAGSALGGFPVAGLIGELGDVRRRRVPFGETELRQRRFRPPGGRRAQGKHGGGGQRRDPGHRRARRHQAADVIEQLRRIGGHARRGRKAARVLGRDAVDHGQPGVEGSAVPGIGTAGDRRREHDAALRLKAHEALAPGRLIGTDIMAGDGDEPSALGEPREGRGEMAHRGFGEAALDMRRGREGRVHRARRSAAPPGRGGRGSARRCAG